MSIAEEIGKRLKSRKLGVDDFYPFSKKHRRPLSEVKKVRYYRPLKEAKSVDLRIGAFDIETKEWVDEEGNWHDARDLSDPDRSFSFGSCMWLDAGGAIQEKVFFDRREMAEFMLDKSFSHYRWWGFASGRFDLIGLYHEDVLNERKFRVLYRNGSIIQLTYLGKPVRSKGKLTYPNRVYFNDLRLITGKKLADLGEVLGILKIENEKRAGGFSEVTEEDIKYNLRDTQIVLLFVKELAELLYSKFKSKMKFTIASIASTVYRTKYLKEVFPEGFRVNEVDRLFRQSYYGGRVELYDKRMEELNVIGFDVNSLYPYVMHKYDYPDPSTLKYYSKLPQNWKEMLGMVKCTVYVPENLRESYPVLPYKTEEGKLIFPVGYFKGAWNVPELVYAMQFGCKILEVEFAVLTEVRVRPFRSFVEEVYGMRMQANAEGNAVYEMMLKKILNGSYGKFAQRIRHEEFGRVADKTKLQKRGNWYVFTDDPYSDYGVWVELDKDGHIIEEDSHQDVVSWASIITSYARIELHKRIMQAVKKGHQVVYSDTDSLFIEEKVKDGNAAESVLEVGRELGLVKIEHRGKAKFFAPKIYMIDEVTGKRVNKHKGVSPNFTWDRKFVSIHKGEKVFRVDKDDEFFDLERGAPRHHGFTWETFSGSFVKLCNLSDLVRNKKPLGAVSIVDRNLSARDEKRDWVGSHGFAKIVNIYEFKEGGGNCKLKTKGGEFFNKQVVKLPSKFNTT